MAARTSVGISMADTGKLLKQLEQLAIQVREKAAGDALRAGMQPVQTAIEATAPQSSVTGSREKQSRATRQKWSGSKTLKNTIRSVVRTKKKAGITNGVIGLVGPSYSEGGGHGNLFSKDHKRRVLWGKDGGTVRVVNQFVKIAADSSKSQAKAAIISSLKSGIEAAARNTTHG